MSNWFIYSIGFLAQFLFSLRLIIQWLKSEQQQRVIAPSIFWSLSLLASILLFIYGYLRNDFAIMLGQCLTYFIYIRNLQIQKKWVQIVNWLRALIFLFPFVVLFYYLNTKSVTLFNFMNADNIPIWLLLLGIISQTLFALRFVAQWIHSEKRKSSLLPKSFWILSLIGSLLILWYAIVRRDPVLIVGHIFGILIYSRNLMLLRQH